MRDERPYGSTAPPAACRRSPAAPQVRARSCLLNDCRGHYTGFGGLYEADPKAGAPASLIEVACWSHSRRKIFDVHVETKSPAAAQALDMIGGASASKLTLRVDRRPNASPRAASGQIPFSMNYACSSYDAGEDQRQERLRQSDPLCDLPLDGLTRYVDDGRLEMSNNLAKRAIRPLTLGRKNYPFAGSDDCGRRAAIMYTLIETARFNDIDPETWLVDVIVRIADHPISKLDELLSWKWEKAAPQAIAAKRPVVIRSRLLVRDAIRVAPSMLGVRCSSTQSTRRLGAPKREVEPVRIMHRRTARDAIGVRSGCVRRS